MVAASTGTAAPMAPHEWQLDSGASSHMTPHRSIFTSYKRLAVDTQVKVANGAYEVAIAKGDVLIQLPSGRQVIQDFYHVPGLDRNLPSEMQLTRRDITLVRTAESTQLLRDGSTIGTAMARGNYWILSSVQPEVALATQATVMVS